MTTENSENTGPEQTEYLLVTEYFHPDTASTGQLMTDLATGLNDRGLDVTVYTGQPNYHSGNNERQPHLHTHEGVLVRRIRAPQIRQTSLPRRLFNWAVFNLWMGLTLLLDAPNRERKVLFVSITPFLPAILAGVCRLRSWEYTLIAYDLYPDQAFELGYIEYGGIIERVWSRLAAFAYRNANHVVSNGPAMNDRIIERFGPQIDDNIELIHNWADEEFITPQRKEENPFSEEYELVEPFTILYSGNIGEFHDLETVVRAAAAFEGENVRFLIIGEGDNKESIVDLAEHLGLTGETITFLPYQPREDLPNSLTSGDVSVVAVREGFEGVCVSSKLYTSLAAGMPVLCIAQPDDDESRIIDEFNAGFHVSQGDIDAVVDAIETWHDDQELVEQQGQNARDSFEKNFTKDQCIDEYYRMLIGENITS